MSLFNELSAPIETGISGDGGIQTSTSETTVIGSTLSTSIESNELIIFDNFINLNQTEVGPGITKSPAIGGFGINRGTEDEFRCYFDEVDDTFKAGLISSIKYVGLTPTSTPTGILKWDFNTKCFDSTGPTDNLSIGNLTLGGTLNINSQTYTWPSVSGISGQVLTTNGSGTLNWTTASGGGGSGTSIVDTGGTTKIETERIGTPDTLFFQANTIDVLQIDQSESKVNNQIKFAGNVNYSPETITSINYSISTGTNFVNWDGSASGVITLPLASNNSGRYIIIQNITSNSYTVTINIQGSDTIDGTISGNILNDKYDTIKVISDGISNWITL